MTVKTKMKPGPLQRWKMTGTRLPQIFSNLVMMRRKRWWRMRGNIVVLETTKRSRSKMKISLLRLVKAMRSQVRNVEIIESKLYCGSK